jgi:hypothetical protein
VRSSRPGAAVVTVYVPGSIGWSAPMAEIATGAPSIRMAICTGEPAAMLIRSVGIRGLTRAMPSRATG